CCTRRSPCNALRFGTHAAGLDAVITGGSGHAGGRGPDRQQPYGRRTARRGVPAGWHTARPRQRRAAARTCVPHGRRRGARRRNTTQHRVHATSDQELTGSMPEIRCSGLRHVYPNGVVALNGVTLELEAGVTGIVGLNGVGKSTLMGILLGALQPTSGTALIDGLTPDDYRVKHRVGYVAEGVRFEGWMRVGEFLDGLAALCNAADYDSFGTDAFRSRRLDELSQVQRRRVEIAAALIGGVALLILDEPTNGL